MTQESEHDLAGPLLRFSQGCNQGVSQAMTSGVYMGKYIFPLPSSLRLLQNPSLWSCRTKAPPLFFPLHLLEAALNSYNCNFSLPGPLYGHLTTWQCVSLNQEGR